MTTTGKPSTTARACGRPGCAGTIEDGYCDICGLAPVAPASASSGPVQAGSGSVISGATGTGNSGTGSTATHSRRARTGSGRSSRGRLGAGLIEIPPVRALDPASALMTDPQVPESKRFCGTCDHAVGRGRNGNPGRSEGFCPNCGTAFSFSPKLGPGDVVAGQYEVAGCLAHGGLGWIYLAQDQHLSNRWVVLKGLLNSEDSGAQAAALAERRFLAEVEHPNIVGVYNFVQHPDPRSGALTGYIVMEYVGGRSLRQLLLDRRAATGESLPVAETLAYAIEVLPALGYLHARGLVYCDFKPDNVIQVEELIKLIDMGAVRRIDDEDSPVFGTVGYQAPEIATLGPSVASDLYTIGRSLAVLTFEFPGWRTEYEHRLPDPADVPVLVKHDSFLRALRRATHSDPASRFESAAEMAEQLTGVLREVLAVSDGQPRPGFSALFSAEVQAIGTPDIEPDDQAAPLVSPTAAEIVAGLPVPVVDSADPAAGFLATLSTLEQGQRIAALTAAVRGEHGTPPTVAESVETRLALARALIVSSDTGQAAAVLADVAALDSGDWRISWYTGLLQLASGDAPQARAAFDAVLDVLPGELAPKLALGLAAEAAGDHAAAGRYLDVVWTVDRGFVSAAFGLARMKVAARDHAGAVAALSAVPESSSQYLAAQVSAIRIRLSPPPGHDWVITTELHEAARQLNSLRLSPAQQQRMKAELLQATLERVRRGQTLGSQPLLGIEPSERAVRFGLERSYRELARLAPDRARRVALVDMANGVRPRTWS